MVTSESVDVVRMGVASYHARVLSRYHVYSARQFRPLPITCAADCEVYARSAR